LRSHFGDLRKDMSNKRFETDSLRRRFAPPSLAAQGRRWAPLRGWRSGHPTIACSARSESSSFALDSVARAR
jgi:hypothetical protein